MNVSDYKRWFVVTVAVVLAIGLSTSVAIAGDTTASDGVAMLSDSVQPVGYVQDMSGPPPSPFEDPAPNAAPTSTPKAATEAAPVEAAPVESGEDVSECSGGCAEEVCGGEVCGEDCGVSSWSKSYVLDLNLRNFMRCHPRLKGSWFRSDYLLWWTKGGYVPAQVTTSSHEDDGSGIIGSPYTSILYGNEVIDFANRSGIRVSGGYDLGCGRSLEFDYMNLGKGFNGRTFSSDGTYTAGNMFLARPLIDNATGNNGAQEIAGDNLRGSIRASQSEYFQSYGLLFRRTLCCPATCGDECYDECCEEECGETCSVLGGNNRLANRLANGCGGLLQIVDPSAWQIDFIGGWRNYRLEEWTKIHESLVVKTGAGIGSTFEINDAFETENVFNGAELGLSARRNHGRWSLDLLAKVGLGSQTQIAQIRGGTIITSNAGAVAVYDAGILALDSNSGRYSRNKFVAIPQLGGEISYQLTKHLRAHMGYEVIYWPEVVRSGALIDMNVDTAQIPPPTGTGTRPAFSWNESDYWAQGLNFGLEARY